MMYLAELPLLLILSLKWRCSRSFKRSGYLMCTTHTSLQIVIKNAAHRIEIQKAFRYLLYQRLTSAYAQEISARLTQRYLRTVSAGLSPPRAVSAFLIRASIPGRTNTEPLGNVSDARTLTHMWTHQGGIFHFT